MSSFNPFSKLFRPASVPLTPRLGTPGATDPAAPATGGIAGMSIGAAKGAISSGAFGGAAAAGGTAGFSGGSAAAGIGAVAGISGAAATPIGGAAASVGDLPLTGVFAGGTVGAPSAQGGAAAAGLTSQFAATSALANLVSRVGLSQIVQVGDQPVAPTIVRGGEEVTAPPLNVGKVDDLIGRLVPILRVQVPRGVSQSIAPGTMVAKGTPIDIVLVPVSDIDFSLFDNVHADLAGKSVESVLPLLADPAVAPILQKANAAALTDADKATLIAKAGTIGVSVDDTVATRSTATLFDSLKNAKAFQ
jgi:hypothetical protein